MAGTTNYPTGLDTEANLPTNRATGTGNPPQDYNNATAAIKAIQGALGVNLTNVYKPAGTDVPVTDGGTGSSTAAGARTNLGAAASGANSDITSLTGLTTPLPQRIVTNTASTSATPNAATTDIYRLSLTGNVTLQIPSGTPTDGQRLTVETFQDATGSRTLTLITGSTGYYIPSTLSAPTLGTAANSVNVLAFRYNGALARWIYYGVI